MPQLPADLYLGFMRNTITGEAFIAPAHGASAAAAESLLRETYPSAAYAITTLYPAQDVQKYLIELERWPGLPSKVQPKLADLLANQRIRAQQGGLPPMPNRVPQPVQAPVNGFNAAQVDQIRTIAKGMPAETQALAARLLAGGLKAQAAQAPMPAAKPAAAPLGAKIETSSTPAPRAPLGTSLKDALAAMRQGGSVPVAPRAPTTEPISRLPASARGVQTEDPTPAPSAFAVGKVSAISVLKALRQRG